jgi:hypothetical protein
MKRIFFILFAVASINIWGQTLFYGRMGDGLTDYPARSVFYDSIDKKLFITGQFKYIENKLMWGAAVWNNNQWDSLRGGFTQHPQSTIGGNASSNYAFSSVRYNNKVYFGGNMYWVNGRNQYFMGIWNGTNWDTLINQPPNSDIMQLLVHNNELYACGNFNKFGDTVCPFVARYDGAFWHPVGDIVKFLRSNPAQINCIAFYKNELYLGGSFKDSTGMDRNIAKFNGTEWVNVGTGIRQGFAWVNNMLEYKNELYIGGYFSKTPETPSKGVIKWDGVQYKPFGFNGFDAGQTSDMKIFKNQLFIVGGMSQVDNVIAGNIVVTDSATICGLRALDEPDFSPGWGQIQNIEPMGDTLVLIGTFTYLDTVKANYIGKIWGTFANYSSCLSIGINELSNHNGVKIYPNPVSNILHIETEQYFEKGAEIEITNTLGQIVLKTIFKNEIDVSPFTNGCYFLRIISADKQQLQTKFIKNE